MSDRPSDTGKAIVLSDADRPTEYIRWRYADRIAKVLQFYDVDNDRLTIRRNPDRPDSVRHQLHAAVAAIVAEAVAADRAGRAEAVNAELPAACVAFLDVWDRPNAGGTVDRLCAAVTTMRAAVARAEAVRPGPAGGDDAAKADRARALDELVAQAQELDMGYGADDGGSAGREGTC